MGRMPTGTHVYISIFTHIIESLLRIIFARTEWNSVNFVRYNVTTNFGAVNIFVNFTLEWNVSYKICRRAYNLAL